MDEREKFEDSFKIAPSSKNKDGVYDNRDIELLYAGWKACAESKQAELDKANARIAQLEKALSGLYYQANMQTNWAETHQEAMEALDGANNTWLSEHDKAVEVRVLEEADRRCINLPASADTVMDCSEVLCLMIESRK